jgi:TonB family protein
MPSASNQRLVILKFKSSPGSKLKRRLVFMLDPKRYINFPIVGHAKVGSFTYIFGLIVLAIGLAPGPAHLIGCEAHRVTQPTTVPVKYENEPDAPLAITDAHAVAGEPREMTLEGYTFNGYKVQLIGKGEKARRINFTVKMVNQSDRNVRQFIVKIQNPAFLSEESILTHSALIKLPRNIFSNNPQQTPTSIGANPSVVPLGGDITEIKPQETYTFTTTIPFNDRKNGVELMSHLSDFRLKIVEVGWGFGQDNEWIQGGKFSNLYGSAFDVVWVYDCEERNRFEILKKHPETVPDAPASGQKTEARIGIVAFPFHNCPPQSPDGRTSFIQADPSAVRQMSASVRPTILYKEKAEYTPEARANKIQGSVVLNVLFTIDGQVTEIRVVRGLPDGLTEKAIEAARRTRFQPAVDNNGAPVNVRGNIEFAFQLDK